MVPDVFRYPTTLAYARQHVADLVSSEQNCLDCRRWFDTTEAMRRSLAEQAAMLAVPRDTESPFAVSIPFVDVVCSHCGKSTILIDPGKYESLKAKSPGLQRYTFRATARKAGAR